MVKINYSVCVCVCLFVGNVGGAFPAPYDASVEILPTWAIAVVSAAGGVTLLWTVAIVLLVSVWASGYVNLPTIFITGDI